MMTSPPLLTAPMAKASVRQGARTFAQLPALVPLTDTNARGAAWERGTAARTIRHTHPRATVGLRIATLLPQVDESTAPRLRAERQVPARTRCRRWSR